MDRNSIIGLSLIFIILITFAYINQPSEEELRLARQKQDSIERVNAQIDSAAAIMQTAEALKPSTNDSVSLTQQYGVFTALTQGTEEWVSIENDEVKLTLSTKGGRPSRIELKKYKTYTGAPLLMLDGDNNEFGYTFATRENKTIQTQELYFVPKVSENGKSIQMIAQLAEGKQLIQMYALNENENIIDYTLKLNGLQDVIAPNSNYLDFNIRQRILSQEKNADNEKRTSTVYYRFTEDEPTYITETEDKKESLKTPVQWISFKQQYFNTTFIGTQPFSNAVVETRSQENSPYVKNMYANLTVPYEHKAEESFGMKIFVGPNLYKTLAKLDIELERIIPMGWGIFRWVNKYVVINVFHFLSQYITGFGLIIFILTLIIKTVLFPLVYRSYLSTAKMRVLKPEMDEIKAKYGDDLGRTQQENMKLYRKAGVNPMGGCLPVLLQMPILIALFQFFPSAFELRQQSFLWAEDLSTFDSVFNLPFTIPGYGAHVSLFALLMTLSSLAYTYYNNQNTGGINEQMKWLTYLMPVVFLFVLNSFPAGLNYYYFVSNLFTIGQQLAIRRFVDDKQLHAQIQENKKKPVKKSRFEQKLEDMARKRGIDPKNLKR
ncbi:MAG: membrane protein insertase YidC [Bacteroidota bacterium]